MTINIISSRRTIICKVVFSLGFLILFFSGCMAVGPDYVPPDFKASDKWHTDLSDSSIVLSTDKDFFTDLIIP